MTSIAIESAYNPVEIDLWGEKFETIDVPRSGARKATELETRVEELTADADGLDDLVETMAELLDVKLRPIGGGSKKPSTLIKKKWKDDKLTVPQLMSFMSAVRETEGEGNRPS